MLAAVIASLTTNGPGCYSHYTSTAAVSDDVQVDHIWSVIPKPSERDGNAVFASLQFWFENGVGGYFGTQVWREGATDGLGRTVRANETHRVIFSVWDAPDAEVGWRGDTCGRFGGEGVGSHCVASVTLLENNAYTLRVRRVGHNGTGDWWTASVMDLKGGGAPVDFGSLYLPDTTGRQGFGKLQTKASAFLEYFEATACDGQAVSSVGLVGPWWQGGTRSQSAPTQAFGSYAPNCSHSDVSDCIYGAGCGPLRVLFTAGGATARVHTNESAPLWPPPPPPSATPPHTVSPWDGPPPPPNASPPPPPLLPYVSSEGGLRLSPQPAVHWQNMACPAGSVEVRPAEVHQTIGGFGASATEASAHNLNALPPHKQEELLALLFGADGAKLSALKLTMCCNDFSTQMPWSTYDDTAGDVSMDDFSIARDMYEGGTVPLVRRAIAAGFGPEGTLQAYLDYPPDWMLKGALPDNATVDPKYYDALALYFARYAEEMRAALGRNLSFIEFFNEPTDSYTAMSAAQLATFLGRHAGPLFEKRGLWPSTKLSYGGQAERHSAHQFVPAVLADKDAAKYSDVIAYHGYDCQLSVRDNPKSNCSAARENYALVADLRARFPSRPLWMTEICYAYNGDDPNCTRAETLGACTDYPRDPTLAPPLPRRDFADGVTWGLRLVREMAAGASGWIYWNMLLDTRGGPFNYDPRHNDGPANWQHPVVVVDTEGGGFHPTGLFWFLAHFARWVRPGAVRVGATAKALPAGVEAVAFAKGGGHVVQLVNSGGDDEKVAVCDGAGHVATLTLPALSITTAVY